MKATKIITMAICALAMSAVLFGCSTDTPTSRTVDPATQEPIATDNNDAKDSIDENGIDVAGQEGLPVTIQAHGNSYTIKSIEVTEDESGNTVISCQTNGFSVLPMKNNKIVIPVYCSVIENGTEIEFASFSTQSDTTEFIFDSSIDPETVIFYPEDSRDDRTEIKVA